MSLHLPSAGAAATVLMTMLSPWLRVDAAPLLSLLLLPPLLPSVC